jgi:hypothetical protein
MGFSVTLFTPNGFTVVFSELLTASQLCLVFMTVCMDHVDVSERFFAR